MSRIVEPAAAGASPKRVLVLGGTGMLGSMVAGVLGSRATLAVTATARPETLATRGEPRLSRVRWRTFDAEAEDPATTGLFDECDWVINCIGVIKPLIREGDVREVERAVRVNSLFPLRLARATQGGPRALQIATDCVYSGTRGGYREGDPHDPLDVYGKTKSLGELTTGRIHHLRCSIVGPEAGTARSLLEWFLGQPRGGAVDGFTNHRWNGLTTLEFARVCAGVIERETALPRVHHLVPGDSVTKRELLAMLAASFGRTDVTVRPAAAPVAVDRTLATDDERLNRELWTAAGHSEPPVIARMIGELARFSGRGELSVADFEARRGAPR